MLLQRHQAQGLVYLVHPVLGVPHALCTSAGGTSRGPFHSLNLGERIGDDPDCVAANRQRLKQAFRLRRLVWVRQVHGSRVSRVGPVAGDCEFLDCDALVTDTPGIGLLVLHADCQAILLHDPDRRVVAAVHCGWRGTVANVLGETVARMARWYGCRPDAIRALVSPSLGPCCAEFRDFERLLPPPLHRFQVRPRHFDFWAISRWQLLRAGLRPEHVAASRLCSRCCPQFFSYRRAKARQKPTGRNGSLIVLDSPPPAAGMRLSDSGVPVP